MDSSLHQPSFRGTRIVSPSMTSMTVPRIDFTPMWVSSHSDFKPAVIFAGDKHTDSLKPVGRRSLVSRDASVIGRRSWLQLFYLEWPMPATSWRA